MRNTEIIKHVRGESVFIDDMKMPDNTLYGVAFTSDIAHGIIKSIDYSKALTLEGVVKIIDHRGIPGENQIGAIIKDKLEEAEIEAEAEGDGG